MRMYRLLPVALPVTLEPGEYVFRDADGIVLSVTLHHPMSSVALAELVARSPHARHIDAAA